MSQSKSEFLRTHTLAGDAFVLNIEEAAAELWKQTGDRERMAHTLVKHGRFSVVLVAIRAGGSLAEHHADGPVTVQIVRGRANVKAADLDQTLVQGDIVALGPAIRHSVAADEDTLLLLTIGAPA